METKIQKIMNQGRGSRTPNSSIPRFQEEEIFLYPTINYQMDSPLGIAKTLDKNSTSSSKIFPPSSLG